MTTKELIEKLQTLDPTGAREVRFDGNFYADGAEAVSFQVDEDMLFFLGE